MQAYTPSARQVRYNIIAARERSLLMVLVGAHNSEPHLVARYVLAAVAVKQRKDLRERSADSRGGSGSGGSGSGGDSGGDSPWSTVNMSGAIPTFAAQVMVLQTASAVSRWHPVRAGWNTGHGASSLQSHPLRCRISYWHMKKCLNYPAVLPHAYIYLQDHSTVHSHSLDAVCQTH
jgi:hypothetical protein